MRKKFSLILLLIFVCVFAYFGMNKADAALDWQHNGATITQSGPYKVGDKITITGKSTGNTTGLKYKIVYRHGNENWNSWGVVKDYNTTASTDYTITKVGLTQIYVDIQDTKGNIVTKIIEVNATLGWQHNGVSIVQSGNISPNQEIEIKASGTGRSDLKYKFVYKYGDNWNTWGVIQNFSTTNTATFKIPKAGKYEFYVDIIDPYKNQITKTISITSQVNFTHKGVTIEKKDVYNTGDSINISSSATNSTIGFQYKFVYKIGDDWSKWGVIKDFSTSNSISFKIPSTGNFEIYADIKDQYGNIVTKTAKFTSNTKYEFTGVKLSKTNPAIGEEITISPIISGNTQNLTYKYVYTYGDGWSDWGVIKGHSTSTSVKFTPTKTGKLTFYIDVLQTDGYEQTKTATINLAMSINSSVKVTLSNSTATIPLGKSFYCKKTSVSPSTSSVKFISDNLGVATVDSKYGYIKGVGVGSANIYVVDSSNKAAAVCKVTVTNAEAVTHAYSSPNCATVGSNVNLIAITDKTKTGVRFTVNGQTVTASSKVSDGNTYVWTATAKMSKAGEFSAVAYSQYNGVWSTNSGGNTTVFVSNSTNLDTPTVENKRLSDKGMKFIAECEGFSSTVYDDAYAPDAPTLGYGKVIYAGEYFYNNITEKQGFAMLVNLANTGSYSKNVNSFLVNNGIKFNQQQFDALVSFSYNVGTGWTSSSSLRNTMLNGTETTGSGSTGTVNTQTGSLNIRSGPGSGYGVIGTAAKGSVVTIIKSQDGWYNIKSSTGIEGWVSAGYISISTSGSRNLNYVDKNQFATQFNQWHHSGGQCVKGLLSRRINELEMFFEKDYVRTMPATNRTYPIPDCIKGNWYW